MSNHSVRCTAALAVALAAGSVFAEAPGALVGARLRVVVSGAGAAAREQVQILDGGTWVDALDTNGSVLRTQGADGLAPDCAVGKSLPTAHASWCGAPALAVPTSASYGSVQTRTWSP